jgi:DNA-binding response OmpR family regulator
LNILLIEADRALRERIEKLLTAENFHVQTASGIQSAADFDLIILGEAAEMCRELRAKGVDASILMLTAERVKGLRLGADDCVSRSCDLNELLARVEALLRRVPKARRSRSAHLRFGDVEINFAIAEARKGGRLLAMSMKELRLMQYLADHRERVVTRKEILSNVWEYDATVSSRTVDVHIGWLRQKLEDDPQRPKYITTIRGRGYRFDCDVTAEMRASSTKLVSKSDTTKVSNVNQA